MTTDLAFFRATMPESSALATGADDALKDLDNTWFLRGQPDDVRRAWFDRIRILRLVDRLAEAERANPCACAITDPVSDWRRSLDRAYDSWLSGTKDQAKKNGWSFGVYINAIETYCVSGERPDDIDDHTAMLGCISGAMFQLFPFVPDEHRCHIWHFGILDGFYNNLRDLAEDSAAGLCYFPTDVLERHGLTRDDVLTGRCIGMVGWDGLMRFWLDEYLPTLRERATPFIEAAGLHPSLEALREWSMHRWRRVESVFRSVGYDYKAFQVLYWAEVRRELLGEEAA
jgi:phytoene synthase